MPGTFLKSPHHLTVEETEAQGGEKLREVLQSWGPGPALWSRPLPSTPCPSSPLPPAWGPKPGAVRAGHAGTGQPADASLAMGVPDGGPCEPTSCPARLLAKASPSPAEQECGGPWKESRVVCVCDFCAPKQCTEEAQKNWLSQERIARWASETLTPCVYFIF